MATRYTDEEAQEILRRALERAPDADTGHRHEVLQEAAAEVGIAPDVFERVAAEYREEAWITRNLEANRRGKIQAYWRGFGTFALVNLFLFSLDMLTGGGTWFQYPLLIWGLFVALRGYRVLLPPSDAAHAKAFAKEKKRLRRLQQRQAERLARATRDDQRKQRGRSRGGAGSELERSIERGVAAFLDALARQMEPPAAGQPPAKTDFGRYVEKQQRPTAHAPAAGAPLVTPPPAARAPKADVRGPVDPPVGEEEPAEAVSSPRDRRGKR